LFFFNSYAVLFIRFAKVKINKINYKSLMSINFGIYWASNTGEYSSPQINSDDPNEPFEKGYRDTYQPFPDSHPEEQKYKELHLKLFADGPKLKFVASDKFVGPLFGYVFYMGPKGLGYYIDPLIMRHVFYKN
jgi:hypothetical protein